MLENHFLFPQYICWQPLARSWFHFFNSHEVNWLYWISLMLGDLFPRMMTDKFSCRNTFCLFIYLWFVHALNNDAKFGLVFLLYVSRFFTKSKVPVIILVLTFISVSLLLHYFNEAFLNLPINSYIAIFQIFFLLDLDIMNVSGVLAG